MKFRYLIEASDNPALPFHLCTVDEEGETTGRLGDYESEADAKAEAEAIAQDENGDRVALVWKAPPSAWEPDAVAVSQYLREMYPGLPL